MDTIECLKKRRSIRNYTGKEISKEIIEEIVYCGCLAATANNIQPCEFIIIKDKEMLNRISDITDYGKFTSDSDTCVIVLSQDTKYYLEDGSAATQNILVAARAYDIGSCWIAGDKKHYCSKIKELLDVPDTFKLISIISLGYTDELNPDIKKKEPKDIVHWNKY